MKTTYKSNFEKDGPVKGKKTRGSRQKLIKRPLGVVPRNLEILQEFKQEIPKNSGPPSRSYAKIATWLKPNA